MPGSRIFFCLASSGWKLLMTALALQVPVPCGIPTTQGLKSQEPHSFAMRVPGPHKSLFYTVPQAASGSLAEI